MKIIFLVTSLLLYLFAPIKYNLFYCNALTIIFLLQIVPFIIKRSSGNYVNFYTFFFFSYFFTNFFYPSVLYPINSEFFPVFTLPFDHNYINKGTALALLSSSCFVFGVSRIRMTKLNSEVSNLNIQSYNHFPIIIIATLFFLLFIGTVGNEFLKGNFMGASIFSTYVFIITETFYYLSIFVFFRYYSVQKRKLFLVLSVSVYIFIFLIIGDRGPALSLILFTIGMYSYYIKRIPKKYMVIGVVGGFILMHLIGVGRTTDIYENDTNIIKRSLEKEKSKEIGFLYGITESFVVNTRNLYVGIEYVEDNGINFGKTSLLPSVLSIIPFAQSSLEKLTSVKIQTSSVFFTEMAFGNNPTYGLGTNLIADIYISFGLLGCILLFYFFGNVIETLRFKMAINNSSIPSIIYFILFSLSLYYSRTGIFGPIRIIVWTILIFTILKRMKILKV